MPSRPPERSARSGTGRQAVLAAALVALALAGPSPAMAQEPSVPPARVRVLIIRGVFNVFSTGLDDLGQELRDRGYDVEVSSPGGSWGGALRLRETYERDPQGPPLVIIGHSMGGRACLHISRYLQSYNIPVKLVVIMDANPWVTVPENVERCVNLYVTNPYGVFHGSPVRGEGAAQVLNYDVTKVERPEWADPVNHFSIHSSEWMHGVVIGEIARAYAPWRAARAGASSMQRSQRAFAAPADRGFVSPVSGPVQHSRPSGNSLSPPRDTAAGSAPSLPPVGATSGGQPDRPQQTIHLRL
jgi:hypothetical protein